MVSPKLVKLSTVGRWGGEGKGPADEGTSNYRDGCDTNFAIHFQMNIHHFTSIILVLPKDKPERALSD